MATQPSSVRVRIVDIDCCMAAPGFLDNKEVRKVPIIRVFGTTDGGVPACVHLHQLYPYFFVSYPGDTDPRTVQEYLHNLRRGINHALALQMKLPPNSPKAYYVKRIILVKGVDFYGFHSGYTPFLKIYLYDPSLVTRCVTALRTGSIMRTRFTIYESHHVFKDQVMCDFALYGCNWLELGEVFQRGDSMEDTSWGVSSYPPQTRMSLELDACAHQILNRLVVPARNLHEKLRIPALPPSPDPLVSSVRELWDDERRRRVEKGLPPSPEMPQVLSQGSRGAGGAWERLGRMQEALRQRVAQDGPWKEPQPQEWEQYVPTTFESVDALWDPEHQTWTRPPPPKIDVLPEQPQRDKRKDEDSGDEFHVDESLILSQAFDDDLQEELTRENEAPIPVEDDPPLDLDDEAPSDGPQSFKAPLTPSKHRHRAPTPSFSPSKLAHVAAPVQSLARADDGTQHPSRAQTMQATQAPSQIYQEFSRTVPTADEFSQPSSSQRPRKRRRLDGLGFDSAESSQELSQDLAFSDGASAFEFAERAPTRAELLSSLNEHQLRHTLYADPHYSNPSDAPSRITEYAGREFDLRHGVPEWDDGVVWRNRFSQLKGKNVPGWEFVGRTAPRLGEIRRWLEKEDEEGEVHSATPSQPMLRSQIEGPTQKIDSQPLGPAGVRDSSHMSVMALEVFALSQGDKQPDPQHDTVCAVFYAFSPSSTGTFESTSVRRQAYTTGIIAVGNATLDPKRLREHEMEVVKSELDLLNRVIDLVLELDPDIVAGWDLQVASWGYLRARANTYSLDFLDMCGRAGPPTGRQGSENYSATHTSIIRLVGRHVLNVWRIMRVDMALSSYSFENVSFHVLKRRMPHYPAKTLTEWTKSNLPLHNGRVLAYFADRTACVLDILDETETITKHAESARVFGIDFFSSISRGSQYKVESFLFRIGKPESFVILSPSGDEVGHQNAIYATPLILEPFAAYYSSPLVVLDFQSLYPSIMIAYNYCYSTCLGRVEQQNGHWKLGVLPEFELPPGLLGKLEDHVNVAPNGIMYAKKEVRPGLLGRMLQELLDTRIMVKQAMKSSKGDKGLYRTLDARQLSLKFICNVTYGYTSATFSGRMPAVEIADSIVQSGRETLDQAIRTIQNTSKWGATVVYGDTDSLFIYLPGRTKEQAFRIGHDIADTITAMNPDPIKLKFEKVYLPSVLMTKKRYVGFKYEHPDELEPSFDAKGIETVRRDGTPATQKMQETVIKMLFRTQDLSAIKSYCERTWYKILEGRAQLQDFIFAKEVRMGTYSADHPPPPGVMVAARQQLEDPNNEVQYADRVKYVIPQRNVPGERLVNRSISPQEFLQLGLDLDAEYYIERMLIPPLQRVLSLVGVDIKKWYIEMAKPQRARRKELRDGTARSKIDAHFKSAQCIVCRATGFLNHGVCQDCLHAPSTSIYRLERRVRARETKQTSAHLVCVTCTGCAPGEEIKCDSLDCAWFFERHKLADEAAYLQDLKQALKFIVASHDARKPKVN
ncbi:hypothetical protein AURDEDRAFT_144423 [Auricularia subglabra TFB-10046 SS5]|nr:hypothetical protein AURDEDRAFT_144423 [Auricularia subglabra TFB-10046 SS5]